MRGFLLYGVVLAALVLAGAASGQGVVVPPDGFANTAVSSTGPGSDVYHGLVGSGVPSDDRNKWHVTIFYDANNAASQQVLRQWQSDPDLQAIAAWGHFNVLDTNRLSHAERFRVFQAAGPNLPILAVYPPKDSQAYPYQYVVRKSGADLVAMRPRDLAVHVVTQVRSFVSRVTGRDCPGPWCPTPNRPRPQPDSPNPYPPAPSPDVMPPLPSIPDVPDVSPQPPKPNTPDEPATGEFPDYALVTIIVDPHGLGERIKAKGLEMIVERVAARYSGFERPKARILRLTDPEAKAYPVGPADTPAVVLTHRGKIVGYVTGLVLDVLKENLDLPAPLPDTPVPPTVIVDNSGVEQAIQEQSRLADARDAASLAANEKLVGLLGGLATVLGISIPGAGVILAIGLGVAAYIFKRRGGVAGYRKRREGRLNWVHDRLPPRVAARTRRLRNRIRRRFGMDALPDDADELDPDELEELEQDLEAEAAEKVADAPVAPAPPKPARRKASK